MLIADVLNTRSIEISPQPYPCEGAVSWPRRCPLAFQKEVDTNFLSCSPAMVTFLGRRYLGSLERSYCGKGEEHPQKRERAGSSIGSPIAAARGLDWTLGQMLENANVT